MSKMNAIRLINLNYNNNAIRISDEVFRLNSESTLFSMQNGAGKTVLVQMVTAPFVHKRYRDTKDRPFESYFTTAKPTFIMIEWALDQGAGYVLTGMMVRRNQDISEGSQETLEMMNFISEYREPCMQDINQLPVIEKNKKEMKIKSFTVCRQLFENYKKDRNMQFFCYDMSNAAQSRQYFDRLQEYQINYKEWETIIKKVNLKESGLSDLFSDCKDEKGLIEKWFLDAVESKLNKEQNRMQEFQNIIQKYTIQYKDNKSKIERRDTIRLFHEHAAHMDRAIAAYQSAGERKKDFENRIASFLRELKALEAVINQNIMEVKQEILQIEEQIRDTEYAQISHKIHGLQKEERNLESNRDMIVMEQEDLERQLVQVQKKLYLLAAAKQDLQVKEREAEWQEVRQQLEISKRKQEDLEPERNALGYQLRCYFGQELKNVQNRQQEKETQSIDAEEKRVEAEKRLVLIQEQMEQLHKEQGALQAKQQGFQEKEDTYNRRYQVSFSRSILGEYEPGMLEVYQATCEKERTALDRLRIRKKREQEDGLEKQRGMERHGEELREVYTETKTSLSMDQKKLAEYEQQLAERRKYLRYLGIPETEVFETENILHISQRKLKEMDLEKRRLQQEEEGLQKECTRLTQGKVLELAPEFERMLEELGLHYLYGMEWMKKNNFSEQENQALVRANPFLPYALILSRADLERLKGNKEKVYTSSPVPIVLREHLDKKQSINGAVICSFPDVNFYMYFNEKLLDENMLARLVAEKTEQIHKKQELIKRKEEEYQGYFSRQEIIRNQEVTKEFYQGLVQKIEDTKAHISELEQEIVAQTKARKDLADQMELLKKEIQEAEEHTRFYERRKEEFIQFLVSYEQYVEDQKALQKCLDQLGKQENAKRIAEEIRNRQQEIKNTLQREFYQLEQEAKKLSEQEILFQEFEEGTKEAGEELESISEISALRARFDAITNQISGERKQLENRLTQTTKNYEKAKEELQHLEKKYFLNSEEYANILYDRKEETHQETQSEALRMKIELKKNQYHEEERKLAVVSHDLRNEKALMQKRFQKEAPLPEQEIYDTDFEAQLNKQRYQKSETEKQRQRYEERGRLYTQNLTALAEYEQLQPEQEIIWEEQFEEMNEEQLRKFQGMLKRDYKESMEQTTKEKEGLDLLLNQTLQIEEFREDFFRKPLEQMQLLTGEAGRIKKQLDTILQSYDQLMQKLDVDISMIEKEKERIIELLAEYVKEVHENLGKIDHNSTITVRDRSIKMLKIKLPDWEENQNLYQIRLQDFMDEITRKGVELFEKNENAPEYFGTRVTTKNLYDTVIGIANVQIGLYKIEAYREYSITWTEVAKNSGGEGFLSAFVILSSLLYYMRKDDSDIFADRNEGKVLVMDNPFAQTNATHLLKPLMDMAKKTNTQLICLSGLGGESIYNRFDNIYVLNLITASMRSGMQYVKSEHLRGTEAEDVVASQIEVFEQQELLF